MKIPFRLYYANGNQVKGTNLHEQTTYYLEFSRKLTDEERLYIKRNYSTLMIDSYRSYSIQFRNYVGLVQLFGQPYRVRSHKWNERQVEQLWAEVSQQFATLPYRQFSVVSQVVERAADVDATRYQQWMFLRGQLLTSSDKLLLDAWESIASEPHTLIREHWEQQDPWMVAHLAEDALHQIADTGDYLTLRPGHPLQGSRLASRLHQASGSVLYPAKITETMKHLTYDTNENRFIKQMLGELLEVIDWMAAYLDRKQREHGIHRVDDIERDNHQMRSLLLDRLSVPWLAEVGRFTGLAGNSTVLQRRQGYRQWFLYYQEFQQGIRIPLDPKDLAYLIETKDIARLFEYWCFFEVLQAVEAVTGCARGSVQLTFIGTGEHLKEGAGVHYTWQNETISVYFNKSFSRKSGGSYSLELRPDISIRWRDKWYHFDAKFKDAYGRDEFYKKEDMEKMHVYRDAIKDTRLAVALYPAKEQTVEHLLPVAEDADGVGSLGLVLAGGNDHLTRLMSKILRV